jgi:hypothetical protein
MPAGPIDRAERHLEDWEALADAINQALGAKGIKRTDEMRRAREEMDSELYKSLSYYERWIASMESILAEKKVLSREEIERKVAQMEKRWGRE